MARRSRLPARVHRALSAARVYRALSAARVYRALSAARVHRALTAARAYRALHSSGPPFQEAGEQLLLGSLHLPRRSGVRLRSCLALQLLDRDIRFQLSR